MAQHSPEKAKKALESVLPQVYKQNSGKSYLEIIKAYAESKKQPRDLLFFKTAISKVVTKSDIFSKFPQPYKHILHALADQNTPSSRAFLAYLFQNYSLDCTHAYTHTPAKHDPEFWMSLLFSAYSGFQTQYPHQARDLLHQFSFPQYTASASASAKTQTELTLVVDNHRLEKVLYEAAFWGHLGTVEYLVNRNKPTFTDYDKNRAFYKAAEGGHLKVFQFLVDAFQNYYKIEYLKFEILRNMAFSVAIQKSHFQFCQYLLSTYSDYYQSYQGSATINSLLEDAAEHGDLKILQFLLEKCKSYLKNWQIEMAFQLAVKHDHLEIVQYLFDKSGLVFSGETIRKAFENASMRGHVKISEYLKLDIRR